MRIFNFFTGKKGVVLAALSGIILIASTFHVQGQMLKVEGQKIVVSGTSQEVVLNAMNFGNWMVMEGYMMGSTSQAPDQHTWKRKLNALIGSGNTATFYNAWLANYVTQADINKVKEWGFNSVRLPLHYEYFVNLGTPDVWNEQGFKILDNVLNWCSMAGVYVIIDLHAAPGGQSNNNISDYDSSKPSLWESEENKTKTVKLWRKISERYRNNTIIAGYDLINEPAWDIPGGLALRRLYGRLTDTIRSNNDNHILFIEGNWYSNDYTGLTPAWDANMVYVFHKYWSNNTSNDIKWVLDLRAAQNRPIWCGEHGENSNDNFTKTVELFRSNNIGMSWWPMKKFESINDFADAKWPAGYQDLLNYFSGTNPNYDPGIAIKTLNELAENLKLANCTEQTEVLRAIFKQPTHRNTQAFASNNIPGLIYATHFDMGMNGYAYNDEAWEDLKVTTGNYTAWNNGWTYRNTGVDIEKCTDTLSNGYSVGWFNAGEWIKFTANLEKPGTYLLELRVANGGNANTILQIQNADGSQTMASVNVPLTGNWKEWTTVSCNVSFPGQNTQVFRLVVTEGAANVASLNFVYQNSEISGWTTAPTYEKTIQMRGNTGKYVTHNNAGNMLSASSSVAGKTEEFTVVDAGNGMVALRGNNLKYVTLSSDNKLFCTAGSIGNSEKFTLTNLCGVYTIRGSNNMFVSSEDGSPNGMVCNRGTAGGWEYFPWQLQYTTRTYPVGVEKNSDSGKGLLLYPNPALNTLHIRHETSNQAQIYILNISGAVIFTTHTLQNETTIDVSHLPAGMYFVKWLDKNTEHTEKFLKLD